MAFRQDNKEHGKFMRSSRQALLELGIPLRTLDIDAWGYLLEHGNCGYTNWTIDDLDDQQLSKLLKIVESYGGNYSQVLYRDIENRLRNE